MNIKLAQKGAFGRLKKPGLLNGAQGFSLLEIVLAIAILAVVAVGLLSAFGTASKALFIADERATAESLARTQMEFIKKQPFSTNEWDYTLTTLTRSHVQAPSWWPSTPPPLLSSYYSNYKINARAVNFDSDGSGAIETPGADAGIRKVTVRVTHNETKLVITLEDYEVDRTK